MTAVRGWRRAVVAALAASALVAAAPPQDWRAEFDDICSKTQDAMVLQKEELRRLVERCDQLKPRIDQLEESQRKVFSKRLKACRDLYQFVLDSQEKA